MKARRLPGVRCSTLKTACRSLLCLMIMPGRSWVAGMAILNCSPWLPHARRYLGLTEGPYSHDRRCGLTSVFYTAWLNLKIRREWPETMPMGNLAASGVRQLEYE